jgi:glutaconate CoA-transferase subunit A
MTMLSLDDLAARIPDGCLLAIPPDYSGVAMAATRALIRRGARDLRLLAVPQCGIQADMLIGAGCVRSIEAAAVTMGEFGGAPRFNAAIKAGAIEIRDSTCPAIHTALQASEKGVPFMPLRGILGTDILAHRPDWKVQNNPFAPDTGDGSGDPIVLLPAIRPDIALFHAPRADRAGNVWIGRRRELVTMAHAAAMTFVTVEEIVEEDLLADEASAAGTLPGLYVSGVAEAPMGARPLALAEHYDSDTEHLGEYVRLARSEEGFADYLQRHVYAQGIAA